MPSSTPLTYAALAELSRALRATAVLSVYIDGEAADPAHRRMWRQELRNALDDARAEVASQPKESREAFEKSVGLLDAALAEITSAIDAPGWVAFVADDGVRLHGPVPTPMPTVVKWRVGAWVSPCVRALKQSHPAFVAMVDSRSVDLYRYGGGVLTRVAQLHANHAGGHADHMGDAPREHFHGGTRGETATDAAELARLSARDQMLRETILLVQDVLRRDGVLIIGGTPETAGALRRAIPAPFLPRVRVSDDLPAGSSDAEIARAAGRDASTMRNHSDAEAVERVVNLAGAHGRGVTGARQVLDSTSLGEARHLLLTPRFLSEHSGEAEAAVEFALDHDADVEVLSGEAAAALDAKGGGIAALLRFVHAAPASQANNVPAAAGAGPAPGRQ